MRLPVRDWDKTKLQTRIDNMIGQGWTQKSDIITEDSGMHFSSVTYVCIMEMPDKPNTGRSKRFNRNY